MAKFPAGKVPALEIGSHVICGSLIIADYLDSAFPEPRLWSADPLLTAKEKMLIENLSKVKVKII